MQNVVKVVVRCEEWGELGTLGFFEPDRLDDLLVCIMADGVYIDGDTRHKITKARFAVDAGYESCSFEVWVR